MALGCGTRSALLKDMLRWAAVLLVITIVAAVFAFGGSTPRISQTATALFVLFLALFLIVLGLSHSIHPKQ